MNILLIGGAGSLMDQMMIRLKKAGHRMYLLTGSRNKKQNYRKVCEQYDFTYDSDCMDGIFDSIHPDAVLFLGAFDTNFSWQDERRDSVKYISGLTNLLSAFSTGNYGRFVYLSSQEVFSGDYPENIREEEPVSATGFRGMAIAQGEKLCKSYQESRQKDIVTLRVDHLYSIPKSRKEVDGICADMCLSALTDRKITANVKHRFSMIYETDAVEYIYRVMVCKGHLSDIYHISSSEEISESALAEIIRKTAGADVRIVGQEDWQERKVLSNTRFNEEFGNCMFHTASEIAGKMMSAMMRGKKAFRENQAQKKHHLIRVKERMGKLMQTLVPLLGNIICFFLFFLLNNSAFGSNYFTRVDFYLLYVLLSAIIYGQQQAMISAVLAAAGYLFWQIDNQAGFEVMLDYNTYAWIAQLFILGLVVGYMRDQIRFMTDGNEEEQEFPAALGEAAADHNPGIIRVEDVLEARTVNHNDGIGRIYHITSQLDRYTPKEVLSYAAKAVSLLMGARDAAIYTVMDKDYAYLTSATSEDAGRCGDFICYRKMEEMSVSLKARKVFINRAIDRRLPCMASGIYERDEMKFILMIFGISLEQMTLEQADLLAVISSLIQNALLRANRCIDESEVK